MTPDEPARDEPATTPEMHKSISDAVAAGRLVVRVMTAEERALNPPRPPAPPRPRTDARRRPR